MSAMEACRCPFASPPAPVGGDPALVVVGWLFLVVTGWIAVQSLRLTVVVAFQGLAGGIVWRIVRRGPIPIVEQAGVGLAIGTTMSMVSGLAVTTLAGAAGGGSCRWSPAGLWRFGIRVRTRGALLLPTERLPRPGRDPRGGARVTRPQHPELPARVDGMWSRYHPDMLFFESLATSLSQLGPLDSIFTPDSMVRYHWLVYAWSGQVTVAADAAPFVVLTRVLPFVAVVGCSLIGIAWARRLSQVVWVPALAVRAARDGRLRRSHLRGDLQLRLPIAVAHDTVAGGAGVHRHPTAAC